MKMSVAALMLGMIAAGAAHAALSDGLVGHWRLDDGSGSTAADASGNGNTGTPVNIDPNTAWGDGKIGGGLSFGGTND